MNPLPLYLSPLSTKRDKPFFFSICQKDFTQKIKLQISNFKQRESHTSATTQPYPHTSPSNQIVLKKLSLSGSCSVLRISFTLETLSLSLS